MKISGEIAHFRPADRPYQTCHNCLYRVGNTCEMVNIVTKPTWVCDSWVQDPSR
jgi:hypothetical protein